ncbi:MAG: hypothetical protein IPN49_08205 [Saprospiraceae bacterium]|nr:hypothetical protein [Saprospiraceae bacterium]
MASLPSVDQRPLYKIVSFFLNGFSASYSIDYYRKVIGASLRKQNKKLVIFLDDLDRLDGDEILEVFKIIRNSFDIANTFFIIGFDLDYVISQIKEKINSDLEKSITYLDKIFQLKINLPSISDYNWIKEFDQLALKHLKLNEDSFNLYSFPIDSQRELIKLINSFKVLFNKMIKMNLI